MSKFYKTKLTLEVEVETQFGPGDAVSMIVNNLKPYPAVKSMSLVGLITDYECASNKDYNYSIINNIPCSLK